MNRRPYFSYSNTHNSHTGPGILEQIVHFIAFTVPTAIEDLFFTDLRNINQGTLKARSIAEAIRMQVILMTHTGGC